LTLKEVKIAQNFNSNARYGKFSHLGSQIGAAESQIGAAESLIGAADSQIVAGRAAVPSFGGEKSCSSHLGWRKPGSSHHDPAAVPISEGYDHYPS
jgi:hypothetical protein